jgi:hypothetical protein
MASDARPLDLFEPLTPTEVEAVLQLKDAVAGTVQVRRRGPGLVGGGSPRARASLHRAPPPRGAAKGSWQLARARAGGAFRRAGGGRSRAPGARRRAPRRARRQPLTRARAGPAPRPARPAPPRPAPPRPAPQKHPELQLFCNDWAYVRYLRARWVVGPAGLWEGWQGASLPLAPPGMQRQQQPCPDAARPQRRGPSWQHSSG